MRSMVKEKQKPLGCCSAATSSPAATESIRPDLPWPLVPTTQHTPLWWPGGFSVTAGLTGLRSTSHRKVTYPFPEVDAHSPASKCWSWGAWLLQHVRSSWADGPLLTKYTSPNRSGSTLRAVCSTSQRNSQELESCLAEEKFPSRCLNPVKAQVPMPTRKGTPARPAHRPT